MSSNQHKEKEKQFAKKEEEKEEKMKLFLLLLPQKQEPPLLAPAAGSRDSGWEVEVMMGRHAGSKNPLPKKKKNKEKKKLCCLSEFQGGRILPAEHLHPLLFFLFYTSFQTSIEPPYPNSSSAVGLRH